MRPFTSEASLYRTVIDAGLLEVIEPHHNNEDKIIILPELKGLAGIPDCVMVKVVNSDCVLEFTTISFEFKLSNWKRALTQAYKYRAFSDKSYVVLDMAFEHRAKKHIDMFIKANIGLVSIDQNANYNILYSPFKKRPYSKFLTQKAALIYQTELEKSVSPRGWLSKLSWENLRQSKKPIDFTWVVPPMLEHGT